ncbi:MAG: type I glyceraldehyde-3-phosphate dehydrogenase [Lutibacter sp.]
MIKVAINGFGRIGRLAFRTAIERSQLDVVAINDLADINYLAYLLKYDSVHKRFKGTISVENNYLVVNGKKIRVSAEKSPEKIDWKSLDVDYVIESTGVFTRKSDAEKHLVAGAKKVVVSGPSKDIPMFVFGVNHEKLTSNVKVFSNASCTTNCLGPLVKLLDNHFGFEEGLVTTVHAATASQSTVDGSNKKWRRGRSALNNMIPTTTNAAHAVTTIMPEFKNKLMAMAVRVPTADVSLVDLTVRLKKQTNYSEIKNLIKTASENSLKGIMGYTEDEVVSQDFVSEPKTSVFDASAGLALNNNFFKLISWYDNEFGYATKIVDLIKYAHSL